MTDDKPSAPGAAGGTDWHVPHGYIPAPSYWPLILALGVTVLFWGFMTMTLVSLIGLALMLIALVGWVAEIRHEHERT